jgi:Holliday junction resolvase RusA-like endonuclease
MNELILTLPWAPSVNHYKRVGRIVITKKGKRFQQRVNSKETVGYYYEVYSIYHHHMPLEWLQYAQDDAIRYELIVDMHPPSKRLYDADNRLKVLFDALVHAKVIKDDSQIVKFTVEKKQPCKEGKIIVKIAAKTIALDEK